MARMIASAEVFTHSVKQSIEDIRKDFTSPKDDWMHTLITESEDGMVIAGLDGAFFQNHQTKEELVYEVLVPHIIREGAYRYAFLTSAWMVKGPLAASQETLALADKGLLHTHPDRAEFLVLQVVDREQKTLWLAEIIRHEDKPPELTEWDKSDTKDFGGLMVDPLVEALREEA